MMGSGTTIINNETNNIIKVTRSLKNRGILLKASTWKIG